MVPGKVFLKDLKEKELKNKRIVLRVDFNVDILNQKVVDDFRIKKTLKTIDYLLEKGVQRIVILSHLGQPKEEEKWKKEFSLYPVFLYLKEIYKERIFFFEEKEIERINEINYPENSLVLVENIRFFKGEEENDDNFSKKLSLLGEIYINDAFSASHRESASLSGIAKYLPSYLGLLFEEEIFYLNKIKESPQSPLVVVLGGAKIKDKLPLIEKFLTRADYILLGGGPANTVLKAWGFEIGKSLFEKEMIEKAKNLGSQKAELILPGDFWVKDSPNRKVKRELGKIKKSDNILDIGPIATSYYQKILKKAKTILFNGPLGKVEEGFLEGTKGVFEVFFENSQAFSVVGGGDTLKCLKLLNLEEKITKKENIFLSTGGGAMLKYLADEKLPALEIILNQKNV